MKLSPRTKNKEMVIYMQKGDDSSLLGVDDTLPSTNTASITHRLHVHTHTLILF